MKPTTLVCTVQRKDAVEWALLVAERKNRRESGKPLRVPQSPEAIANATRLAVDLTDKGHSPESRREAVTLAVADPEVAGAILDYVDSQVDSRSKFPGMRGNHERVGGIYLALLQCLTIWCLCRAGEWLYNLVQVAPNEAMPAAAAAVGQAILVRLSWRILKGSGIALTDALNGATYPTVIHKPIVTSSREDRIRRQRIRLLISEMVDRFANGNRFSSLYGELTRIELTKPAAFWLLVQARIGLLIRSYFPPYLSRSRSYLVAGAAALGCTIGIGIVHHRLSVPAQMYYLGTWAALAVAEFLKPPHPVEAPEAV